MFVYSKFAVLERGVLFAAHLIHLKMLFFLGLSNCPFTLAHRTYFEEPTDEHPICFKEWQNINIQFDPKLINLYENYSRDEDRENKTLMGLWFDEVANPKTVFCTKERLR